MPSIDVDLGATSLRESYMNKIIALLCSALIAVSSVSAQSVDDVEYLCGPDDHSGRARTPSSEQINFAVYFEVPEFIETSLSDGSMERVGGVIRFSDDKQVIAWMRQGGQMGQVVESTTGLLAHITQLSGTGNFALGRLISGVSPFLSISMAGFSLIEHIVGIRAHEAELERIYDRVSEEFQRDREVELSAALDYAENILVAKNESYKHEAVAKVTYELGVARSQLLRDLKELLLAEWNQQTAELALNYQVLAMNVCAMSSRLHLEIGEDEAAIDWLSQCVSEQENQTRSFVKKLLGNRRALYFHESVDHEYFERYLNIERWLRGKRDVLPEIVQAYRRSFWDRDALAPLYTGGIRSRIDESPFYETALPNAEALIENFQRLQGIELELKSMCLPTFEEWEAFDGDDGVSIREHDGYVMLVNQALLLGDSQASP